MFTDQVPFYLFQTVSVHSGLWRKCESSPSEYLLLSYSEDASYKEDLACSQSQNHNYLTVFLSPITFPHVSYASALSHNYPETLALETELRFLSCHLPWLPYQTFLYCKPWCLSIWLLAGWVNKLTNFVGSIYIYWPPSSNCFSPPPPPLVNKSLISFLDFLFVCFMKYNWPQHSVSS